MRFFTKGGEKVECLYQEKNGSEEIFSNGGHEYIAPTYLFKNNGKDKLPQIQYQYEGHKFIGLNMRIRAHKTWLWYMNNNVLCTKGNADNEIFEKNKFLFDNEAIIPVIPFKYIDSIVFEAVWKKNV